MRAGLEMNVQMENWNEAATSAGNLSALMMTLGEVAAAVQSAERFVTYADRGGDESRRMAFATTHADALHLVGRRAEAETYFRAAEQMQVRHQLQYPEILVAQFALYGSGLPVVLCIQFWMTAV